jgi:hypothetical protein
MHARLKKRAYKLEDKGDRKCLVRGRMGHLTLVVREHSSDERIDVKDYADLERETKPFWIRAVDWYALKWKHEHAR